MRKQLATVAVVVAVVGVALVPATAMGASGSASSIEGARCVKAGVTFLVQNRLLKAAALREIDYSDLDTDATNPANDDTYNASGPINTDLPNGSNLSLGEVIRLHYTNPQLFDWCSS